MTDLIGQPRIMMAAGNKPKQIAENVARLNSGVEALSGRSRYWTETLRFSDFLEVDRVNRGFSQPVSTQCIFSFCLRSRFTTTSRLIVLRFMASCFSPLDRSKLQPEFRVRG
jgi:hypothetical protein